ncbi:PREDICTED: heterogeneous nuclear ribonucleoprotein U isoform X2 [Dinoponera quadriceps]|uniref:Heterogeneous nuclear ribonucleoprotein U isoform X2 n=1 Tax=Dinoponera quadriceps TaxID=609295 RepID=A0A6P3XQX4_DINQU|nr:PREDICTED: heterogeneous nuclear ribonucleoprotein U isoform X2 [Dinoponera quadriceps]
MDPAKLKVVELRAALAERGLDVKGNKPVLVERLRKALEEENQEHVQDKLDLHTEDINETVLKEAPERVVESTRSSQPPRTPSRASRSSTMVTPTKVSTRNASRTATTLNSSKQSSPNKPQYTEKRHEVLATISESTSEEPLVQQEEISKLSPEKYREEQKDIASNIVQDKIHIQTPSEKPQRKEIKRVDVLEGDKCEANVSQVPAIEPSEKSSTIEHVDQFSRTRKEHEAEELCIDKFSEVQQSLPRALVDETKDAKKIDEKRDIKDIDIDKVQDDNFKKDIEKKNLIQKENIEHVEDTCNVKDNVDIPEVERPTHDTSDQIDRTCDVGLKDEKQTINDHLTAQENKIDVSDNIKDIDEKIDNSNNPQNEQDMQMAETKQEDAKLNTDESNQKDCKDRRRKRSLSPLEVHQTSPAPYKPEEEPDFDEYAVILSYYDSDLNLVISKDGFYSATPMHNDDLCHMWAGTRASYGFANGKVYYETKITENCPTIVQNKEQLHMLRLGWSTLDASMQLGEERFSYAYTSTGKKGTDKGFTDYGSCFGKDDVVGCYLDLTPDNTVELSYTLNGKELGFAFSISKEELGDEPLFPHILSKNCTFVCNFGQEKTWCENISGYVPVGVVELKDRVAGPRRPDRKADCEIIMMCGLPAAGKTAWAKKHAAENPDKRYNILGVDNLVEKTGDIALCQEQNQSRRDVIIDKCNRALDGLLDVAGGRRRNYILDQRSNVYSSVQRRKMRYFCGYQRKAIVIVPADEEYIQRLLTHDAGKSIPDLNLMEMKANFIAPSVGEFFDAVEWVGLNEEESKKLIEKYNKEGKEAGFGQQQPAKRARFDKNEAGNREIRDSRNNRDIPRDHRDRRNNYQDRGGRNPPWRGGNNMGGWRGDRPQRGGYMRHSSGYGPPGPWRMRGRGGPVMRGADRRSSGVDRRQGNDRNRSVATRQGGWSHMSGSYQGSQQSGWGQQDNWSGGQSQSNWNQQGGWGQQQWGGGSWKGYGSAQGTYSHTAGYNQQQGYGNGNWNSWNQQYYNNQYWGQQQQSGQTTAAGSQAVSKQ